jgi:hypothetical protein
MESGKVPTIEDIKMFLAIGFSAGISYLVKNLLLFKHHTSPTVALHLGKQLQAQT